MSIQSGLTNQALLRLYEGAYNWGTDTFKVAFYTEAANLGRSTTAYTTSGEYVGTGYTAGGFTLVTVPQTPANGKISFKWEDVPLGATMNPRGALVYNSTVSNEAVYVIDFGASSNDTTFKMHAEGLFEIQA